MRLDPRALANLILDIAEREGFSVSNLALNKIVYFTHGNYLASRGAPLVDAKIEAWQFGPVFREIYHQFKSSGDKPVKHRARTFNVETESYEACPYELPEDEYNFITAIAIPFIRMKPSALVTLSHEHDSPWHNAWHHDDTVNPGMEITDDAIRAHFCQQVRH